MIKTIAIDEEGYFVLHNGLRVTDEPIGHDMLSQITLDDYGVTHLNFEGDEAIVECFDKPYVARQVHLENNKIVLQMPYQLKEEAEVSSFCVDEWDRFHGKTKRGIPFVLSRPAQAELFNLAEEFDDDSIKINSHQIQTPDYYFANDDVKGSPFWTQKYNEPELPGWDLEKPHPELKSAMNQLKINKCRILVPGCGRGHDAAYLAKQGHIVTALDFSDRALEEAQKLYGDIENLNFVKSDFFEFADNNQSTFDLIFEHTLYCAIAPEKRSKMVKAWKKLLTDDGHLLGIFFVVPKRGGPYFGGSEWELREKMQKDFNFRYWTRLKHSPDWRLGAELLVYSQVKS